MHVSLVYYQVTDNMIALVVIAPAFATTQGHNTPPQESMESGPSLFNYGLNNLYDDLIDDFDPYLEYGEEYQNRTAFEDAFYG